MNYLVIINATGKTGKFTPDQFNAIASGILVYAEEKNVPRKDILLLTAPALPVRTVVDPVAKILDLKPLENEALWGGDGHVTNKSRFNDTIQNGTANMKVVFTNGEYPAGFPGYFGALYGFESRVEGATEPLDAIFIDAKEKTFKKTNLLQAVTAE